MRQVRRRDRPRSVKGGVGALPDGLARVTGGPTPRTGRSGRAARQAEVAHWGRPMTGRKMNQRTDPQLVAMLDNLIEWAMRDENGKALAHTASLRDALTKASGLEREGRRIVALTQQIERVVVYRGQMDRLVKTPRRSTPSRRWT